MPVLTNRPLLATELDSRLFVRANDVAERVVGAVRQGYNVAVFGARGAGKSSLLHHVEYRLRDERRMVFVDASVAGDAVTFLQLVRFRLGPSESPAETRAASFAPFHLQAPRSEVGDLLWVLDDLRETADGSDGERPVTLVVDDLDARIAHTVFGRLRNEMWSLPYRWLVSAPEDSRTTFLTPPADAFFEIAVTIDPMADDVLVSLLLERADGALGPDLAGELARLADGSPRRALALARTALLNDGDAGAIAAAEAAVAERLDRVSGAARMLYDEVKARGQASASDSELLTSFGWSRQRARRVFGELEEAGLVVAQDEARRQPGRPRRIYAPASIPAGP